MQRCLHFQAFRRARRSLLISHFFRSSYRLYSSQSHERVSVRCGSAGHVSIDLMNVAEHSPNSPLFIQLPSFPSSDNQPASIPRFLQGKPLACINYRWNPLDMTGVPSTEGLWPTPVHDVGFAYSWLVDNLAPEGIKRRDIYIYGSHLGASLASSLALTETRPHEPFAVRGFVSYNGIYNWTMFFPDHPTNRPSKRVKRTSAYYRPPEGTYMHYLQQSLPAFFQSPADMFDVFASPSLFFHNPGLKVPSSYHLSEDESAAIEAITNPDAEAVVPTKTPRKSHLVYPPRKSTLKIPETLLLYDTFPAPPPEKTTGVRRRKIPWGNSLELQAHELAEMMQRSVEKVELKERGKWDEDMGVWEDEPTRRIKLREAGEESGSLEMGEKGEEFVEEWLAERIPS